MRPSKADLVRLYVDERHTTREIGAMFGVSKTEVRRWLIEDGTPRRASGCGLANRGVTPPDCSTLHNMIHVEHLSYQEIAERYGVDPTAVPYWVKRHGILPLCRWVSRRKGRRMPSGRELAMLYENGYSAERLAERFGFSATPIYARLREAGVSIRPSGWAGKRWTCQDGHIARSTYEMKVDDWLSAHGVPHSVEPPLPFGSTSRADFLADGTYIEVWGVQNRASYAERKRRKVALYAKHGLGLLGINAGDFSSSGNERWARKLAARFDQHYL